MKIRLGLACCLLAAISAAAQQPTGAALAPNFDKKQIEAKATRNLKDLPASDNVNKLPQEMQQSLPEYKAILNESKSATKLTDEQLKALDARMDRLPFLPKAHPPEHSTEVINECHGDCETSYSSCMNHCRDWFCRFNCKLDGLNCVFGCYRAGTSNLSR